MIKSIDFKGSNILLEQQNGEGETTPARYEEGTTEGKIITAWRLPFKNRIELLFSGVIYIEEKSFNEPISLKRLFTDSYEIYSKKD